MENSNNTRKDKTHLSLGTFSNDVYVICPYCKGQAHVLTTLSKYVIPYPSDTKSIFRCNNCYQKISEKHWYGPVKYIPINKNCGYCGSTLTTIVETTSYINKMKVTCGCCEQTKLYDVKYQLTYANNNQATDPHFGLPLWLQYPVDGHIFWAYNYEHLEYLKKYVSAKLREEMVVSQYSLTQKLPNFIKLAKNRDKILKIIARLQKLDFKPE